MRYFVLKPIEIDSSWLRPRTVEISIDKALGAVTAQDVVCAFDVPNYNSALRDGWAVCSKDDPETRRLVRSCVENGVEPKPLNAGQAVWVNTGGILPQGADAVIASINDWDEKPYCTQANYGDNVEFKGSDWKKGDIVLKASTRIGAREMALIYESGIQSLHVYAAPVVAVISTGSEMVGSAKELKTGLRRCSNASYVQALLERIGVKKLHTAVLDDNAQSIAQALKVFDRICDIVITIGGTGRGSRDYTRKAVDLAGGVCFEQPQAGNSPFVIARLKHASMIGLPGNPLGAMMVMQRLVLEKIRASFHLPEAPVKTVQAILTEEIEKGHCGELCVSLSHDDGKIFASPVSKGTGRMRIFEQACGAVTLKANHLEAASTVEVSLFRN